MLFLMWQFGEMSTFGAADGSVTATGETDMKFDKMRTTIYVLAACIAAPVAAPVAAQDTIPITISSGYPTAFVWTATIQETFIPTVDRLLAETGEYKIAWTEAFAGQLGGPSDQGELVQIGAADIGNVVLPLEQDILPLESVAYIVPFGTIDVALATESIVAMHDTIPEMNEA